MYSSNRIVKYGMSAILVIFAAGAINASVWETLALLILRSGLDSGYHRVWNGPTYESFLFLKVAFLLIFAFPAFYKVRSLIDVYRRFRWIFAAASLFWSFIIPALLVLTRRTTWELSPSFTQLIPEPHTMSILTTVMTALLFVRTRKKRVENSNI
jgi:hypothetical protein